MFLRGAFHRVKQTPRAHQRRRIVGVCCNELGAYAYLRRRICAMAHMGSMNRRFGVRACSVHRASRSFAGLPYICCAWVAAALFLTHPSAPRLMVAYIKKIIAAGTVRQDLTRVAWFRKNAAIFVAAAYMLHAHAHKHRHAAARTLCARTHAPPLRTSARPARQRLSRHLAGSLLLCSPRAGLRVWRCRTGARIAPAGRRFVELAIGWPGIALYRS